MKLKIKGSKGPYRMLFEDKDIHGMVLCSPKDYLYFENYTFKITICEDGHQTSLKDIKGYIHHYNYHGRMITIASIQDITYANRLEKALYEV